MQKVTGFMQVWLRIVINNLKTWICGQAKSTSKDDTAGCTFVVTKVPKVLAQTNPPAPGKCRKPRQSKVKTKPCLLFLFMQFRCLVLFFPDNRCCLCRISKHFPIHSHRIPPVWAGLRALLSKIYNF